MALSRAQHEANKANGSYQTDRHGNRVAPALARSARSNDVVVGERRRIDTGITKDTFHDPLKLQIASLRACGRQAEADRLEGVVRKK
ncbi:hypothetical protein ACVEU2_000656 [Enterobacter hormaechei]|jgi:hypothetical protein|uniref:hypothetical protein n=1 Tax=Enterobacter hormaechei TaxID=158836 RepID=UPI000FCA30BB|nr:hypothetical protein [Enterobacter hormaechei]MCM8329310.1 hypothetical protein [Enterobacter hormaechei]MCM8342851.1 hypothetical protein [Enterobacter hormaechei]MCM8347500.1 hypothetical protein [Enterobacter hormaechei]MDF3734716.1 hypothetical protein [Enterobacter hormaechei]HCM9300095.1 hypothetical protein [Enterobacter hormaechei subsp. xiangfangensis]